MSCIKKRNWPTTAFNTPQIVKGKHTWRQRRPIPSQGAPPQDRLTPLPGSLETAFTKLACQCTEPHSKISH